MLKTISKLLGGDPIAREIERYSEIVNQINELESDMQGLDRQSLRAKTGEFRTRLDDGESMEDLLPEAFAVVRETAVRAIGMRHYDVQLIGGIVLHEGKIAEMKTGEGKTLVATMPIYLNALSGDGVHLVTVNDYLARRDARWMGPIFDFHGMSVGILQEASRTESGRKAFLYNRAKESTQEDVHQMDIVDRADAYAADITYGTNNEFGFDYLRDNMARRLEDRVQRGHHYAILDEVDNILIDEARTPLIISGPAQDDPALYDQMAKVVRQLQPEDYEISERDRTVALTAIGEDHIEQILGASLRDPDRPEDITPEQARLLGHIEQALRAEHHFRRNKQYVVQGGRVIIVDEFTGRMMPGRRWSDGLHQAVEAKEGVKIRQENVTYATITLQNYFRMYEKLAGMTGTAVTEAEEFNKIYSVDVTPLPTNLEYIAMQPDTDLEEIEYREDGNKFHYYTRTDYEEQDPIFWRRKDYPDVVYRTEEAKFRAVATEILRRHVRGQPLLVGTTSVDLSELLSNRLRSDMLKKLSMVHLLRDKYLQVNEMEDDGMRIPELDPLYESFDEMKPSVLRNFARDLGLPNNPTRPENLAHLTAVFELPQSDAERLGQVLDAGIPHNVLNAKKHDEESRIIADAGALGAVTIATNMAGRGVDIKLGGEIAEEVLGAVNRVLRRVDELEDPENMNMEQRLEALDAADEDAIGIYDSEVELFRKFMREGVKVKDVGGLHVLGSERHDARRIDNQLRGRAARQGDPGSSQFFLSLQDELMRLFGGSQVSGLMQRLNIDDAVPIAHGIVNRTIEQAQSRVEGANFDTRKHLLEYDDVLNQQREIFYSQRNRVFSKEDLLEDVRAMLATEVETHVQAAEMDPEGPWKLLAWLEEIQPTLALETADPYPSFMLRVLSEPLLQIGNRAELKDALLDIGAEAMETQHQHLARAVDEQFEAALERLDDQVEQRVEMSEMAIEGAMLEAEDTGREVGGRELLDLIESSAGMRIELDEVGADRIAQDPDTLRRRIPDLVDASLGLRVWAGMVQTIENRIGESLNLERELSLPIDWDEAGDRLQTALAEVWQTRSEKALSDIERELDQSISRAELGELADVVRALVQMSYGQMLVFDRKSHQRRSAIVARLAYPFAAARRLEGVASEDLLEQVMDHLEEAWDALYFLLGQSELARKAGSTVADLDERHLRALRRTLGEERTQELVSAGPIASLDGDSQEEINLIVGQTILSDAYRQLILSVGDQLWVDYLTQMEALRTSIGLEAYGQRDPLVQYKSRAFDMFQNLLDTIRAGVVARMFRIQAPGQVQAAISPTAQAASARAGAPAQIASGRRRKKRRRRG